MDKKKPASQDQQSRSVPGKPDEKTEDRSTRKKKRRRADVSSHSSSENDEDIETAKVTKFAKGASGQKLAKSKKPVKKSRRAPQESESDNETGPAAVAELSESDKNLNSQLIAAATNISRDVLPPFVAELATLDANVKTATDALVALPDGSPEKPKPKLVKRMKFVANELRDMISFVKETGHCWRFKIPEKKDNINAVADLVTRGNSGNSSQIFYMAAEAAAGRPSYDSTPMREVPFLLPVGPFTAPCGLGTSDWGQKRLEEEIDKQIADYPVAMTEEQQAEFRTKQITRKGEWRITVMTTGGVTDAMEAQYPGARIVQRFFHEVVVPYIWFLVLRVVMDPTSSHTSIIREAVHKDVARQAVQDLQAYKDALMTRYDQKTTPVPATIDAGQSIRLKAGVWRENPLYTAKVREEKYGKKKYGFRPRPMYRSYHTMEGFRAAKLLYSDKKEGRVYQPIRMLNPSGTPYDLIVPTHLPPYTGPEMPSEIDEQLRVLVERYSSDATLSDADRAAIAGEIQSIRDEYPDIRASYYCKEGSLLRGAMTITLKIRPDGIFSLSTGIPWSVIGPDAKKSFHVVYEAPKDTLTQGIDNGPDLGDDDDEDGNNGYGGSTRDTRAPNFADDNEEENDGANNNDKMEIDGDTAGAAVDEEGGGSGGGEPEDNQGGDDENNDPAVEQRSDEE